MILAFGQVLNEEVASCAMEQKESLRAAGYEILITDDNKTLLLLIETKQPVKDITVLEPQRMAEAFPSLISHYVHHLSSCGLAFELCRGVSPRWLLVPSGLST